MKVTFIGLGIMGFRMASNLLRNGVELTVYNRTTGPAQDLEKKGARVVLSPDQAVQGSDYVITMLSEPDVVEKIMLNNKGCIHHMKKNALWIDCSTVNPSFSLECKRAAEKTEIRFMDAPVSGTKPQAENGELVFFAGGDENLIKEAEVLLRFMGNKIFHIGKTGQGSAFKMLVNAMLAQSMLIFADTVVLGEKIGLSKEFLMKTLPELAVSAPFLKPKAAKLLNQNNETQFPLEHMQKDLRLLNITASEYDHKPAMASLSMDIYEAAKKEGLAREDFSAIYNYLKGIDM
jgi:3-hydroxyisobutyrate dehydrogenase-like beta-hydroxyacid dehydrogenase